jgi:hypothetical protein
MHIFLGVIISSAIFLNFILSSNLFENSVGLHKDSFSRSMDVTKERFGLFVFVAGKFNSASGYTGPGGEKKNWDQMKSVFPKEFQSLLFPSTYYFIRDSSGWGVCATSLSSYEIYYILTDSRVQNEFITSGNRLIYKGGGIDATSAESICSSL